MEPDGTNPNAKSFVEICNGRIKTFVFGPPSVRLINSILKTSASADSKYIFFLNLWQINEKKIEERVPNERH